MGNSFIDPEFTGQIIDAVDEFLTSKGISIPNNERIKDQAEGCNNAIYGSDYARLHEILETVIRRWQHDNVIRPFLDEETLDELECSEIKAGTENGTVIARVNDDPGAAGISISYIPKGKQEIDVFYSEIKSDPEYRMPGETEKELICYLFADKNSEDYSDKIRYLNTGEIIRK